MAAWLAGQHRRQQGWSRKHRSNPKVSEHFLDKDKSIQRQMTFNDALGLKNCQESSSSPDDTSLLQDPETTWERLQRRAQDAGKVGRQ